MASSISWIRWRHSLRRTNRLPQNVRANVVAETVGGEQINLSAENLSQVPFQVRELEVTNRPREYDHYVDIALRASTWVNKPGIADDRTPTPTSCRHGA